MLNITIESILKSLPKRSVLLRFKLINHDNEDYYFDANRFSYMVAIDISNTWHTRKSGIEWTSCLRSSSLPTKQDMHKISAHGIIEEEINILYRCNFLYIEPLGYEHLLRATHIGFCAEAPIGIEVGCTSIPTLILPFSLIGDTDNDPIEGLIVEEGVVEGALVGAMASKAAASSIGL